MTPPTDDLLPGKWLYVIIYALSGGKLRGMEAEDESLSGSLINSDNNINKAVYGVKAREVLAGKATAWPAISPALNGFQSALTKLSKQ